MARIVFIGNCQATALCRVYNQFIAAEADERAVDVDGRSMSAAQVELVRGAAIRVVQVTDLGDFRQFADAPGRTVLFPYVSGSFIWPYGTESHLRSHEPPLQEFQAFSDELGGDTFLNSLLRQGTTVLQAVETYLDLDIAVSARLDRRYDLALRTQQSRDEKAGLETADYIRRNLTREPLFVTRGHPCRGLFLHLALQLFARLDASPHALTALDRGLLDSPLATDEVPVHPKTIAHFGLVPPQPDHTFHFNMVMVTFREYVERYVRADCEPSLRRGMRLLHAGELHGALTELEHALAFRPRSPIGWTTLSLVLDRLGRKQEALTAAREAVATGPRDLFRHLHLSRFLINRGLFAEAENVLRAGLLLNPDFADTNALLAICVDRQGRAPEALRHARRAAQSWPRGVQAEGHYLTLLERAGLHAREAETEEFGNLPVS